MKIRFGVLTLTLCIGLADYGRADERFERLTAERSAPVEAKPEAQAARDSQPCAEVRCLERAWRWLTYRAPIRGSFCRGIMFGTHEHHPPMYGYFMPAHGSAGCADNGRPRYELTPPERLATPRLPAKNGTTPRMQEMVDKPTTPLEIGWRKR